MQIIMQLLILLEVKIFQDKMFILNIVDSATKGLGYRKNGQDLPGPFI